MKRLFTANLARLQKSRLFHGCSAALIVFSPWNFWVRYSDMQAGYYKGSLDDAVFDPLPFAGSLIAVFCCLFAGDGFGFGTICNKLIAGYTKRQVFFSMLLAGMAAGNGCCTVLFVCCWPSGACAR